MDIKSVLRVSVPARFYSSTSPAADTCCSLLKYTEREGFTRAATTCCRPVNKATPEMKLKAFPYKAGETNLPDMKDHELFENSLMDEKRG